MSTAACLLFAVAAMVPEVEVATLTGKSHTGSLETLSAQNVVVKGSKGTVTLPLADLMSVRFPKAQLPKTAPKTNIVVTLTDGSRIACTAVRTTSRLVKIESSSFGKLSLPIAGVAHIRLQAANTTLDAEWKKLCERARKQDTLVIPKTPKLDQLDGVVGNITNDNVTFTLAGNSVDVAHGRVFGVIYVRNRAVAGALKPLCRVDFVDSNSLQLASFAWDGTKASGTLLSGTKVDLPIATLKSLDFSLGKVKYLSDMEPREVKFTTFYNDPLEAVLFRYRRDRALLKGSQLQLAKTKYAKGLWIYSRTFLKYRLGKDYRRFQAVMGIDDNAGGNGDVHIVIAGDGKTLLEADVRTGDKPRKLDIDVTGVRELSVLVDYGKGQSTSDHLDLADARVIK